MYYTQKQTQAKNNNLKKAVSWVLGVPSGFVALSELNDLRYWWVQFLAMGLLVTLLWWNGVFKEQ